jgi:hypothetical protein
MYIVEHQHKKVANTKRASCHGENEVFSLSAFQSSRSRTIDCVKQETSGTSSSHCSYLQVCLIGKGDTVAMIGFHPPWTSWRIMGVMIFFVAVVIPVGTTESPCSHHVASIVVVCIYECKTPIKVFCVAQTCVVASETAREKAVTGANPTEKYTNDRLIRDACEWWSL